MPVITLAVPADLKKEMDEHKIMNWSEVARIAIRKQIDEIKRMKEIQEFEKIVKKSKLTEKDAIKIGRLINRSANKRLFDELNNRRKHSNSSNNKK